MAQRLLELGLRRLRDEPLGHNPADRFDEEHGAEGRHRALVFHGWVVLLVRPVPARTPKGHGAFD